MKKFNKKLSTYQNILYIWVLILKTLKMEKHYTQEQVDRMLDEQASRTTAEMLDKFKGYKSREEVIAFGKKVKKYCKDGWKEETLHRVFFEWDKWVEENL